MVERVPRHWPDVIGAPAAHSGVQSVGPFHVILDEVMVSDLFNAAYRHVYLVMADLFSPVLEKPGHVGRLYRLMSGVLSPLARHMVTLELEDGDHAAPTFEVYEFGGRDPSEETLQLAADVREAHPELTPVVDALEAAVT